MNTQCTASWTIWSHNNTYPTHPLPEPTIRLANLKSNYIPPQSSSWSCLNNVSPSWDLWNDRLEKYRAEVEQREAAITNFSSVHIRIEKKPQNTPCAKQWSSWISINMSDQAVAKAYSYLKKNKFLEELIAYFPLIQHGPHRKRSVQQFYCCMCIRFYIAVA
jgi:hypothetical protein